MEPFVWCLRDIIVRISYEEINTKSLQQDYCGKKGNSPTYIKRVMTNALYTWLLAVSVYAGVRQDYPNSNGVTDGMDYGSVPVF